VAVLAAGDCRPILYVHFNYLHDISHAPFHRGGCLAGRLIFVVENSSTTLLPLVLDGVHDNYDLARLNCIKKSVHNMTR
jgi:hypothetical protein